MGFFDWLRKNRKKPWEEVCDETGVEQELSVPESIEVTDLLDLHGFFPEQVRHMVPDFIDHAVQLGYEEVKIIHGKGKGKLKAAVFERLSKHPLVVSYRDAPPYSSGWGATIVCLKKRLNSP